MSWCLDECLQDDCDRLVDGSCESGYCSPVCEAAASNAHDDDDDQQHDNSHHHDKSYSSWLRVKAWAENIPPASPHSPRILISPSRRILTPPYPTACITSDSPTPENPHPSPPRPARTAASTTAAQSLVASSGGPVTPISLGSLMRWAAPRPQLARNTTSKFTVFAKAHPPPPLLLPSDASDSDVSPVWCVGPEPRSSSKPRLVIQHRGRTHSRALP